MIRMKRMPFLVFFDFANDFLEFAACRKTSDKSVLSVFKTTPVDQNGVTKSLNIGESLSFSERIGFSMSHLMPKSGSFQRRLPSEALL